jgi:hypothetical protein
LDQSGPGSHAGIAAQPGLRRSTEEVLMRLIKDLGEWFDQRLQLGKPIKETMEHPVPRKHASWAYVFGSASLTVMMLQFVTGICLAFVYVPSADQAWTSLQVLNHQQSFGWFIRACMAGVPTSWWLWCSFTWCRCSCSALTNFPAN